MQNILVINSGSSSLKFQLIQMPDEKILASGQVERIGQDPAKIKYSSDKHSVSEEKHIKDHSVALKSITDMLMDPEKGVIEDASEIPAIGHRIVHGGEDFTETTLIDEEVKSTIKKLFSLAPLHNPPNYKGIEIAEEVFPDAKQVGVFDTTFHRTIPEKAARFAIPDELYKKEKIQLYGFHGISHKYVSGRAIEHLEKEDSKIISLHLGNGCSMTAIRNGKSIDHSMGFGPVTGLIMGTRSGDIDQSVIFYMIDKLGYSTGEVGKILQNKSGLLGLTGYSDMRDIQDGYKNGDEKCILALEMTAYRIQKYIGAYATAMQGLDALVFTAGIGEKSFILRELICKDLDFLGIKLDKEKNNEQLEEMREVSAEDSKVKILVIPTNEELEIARETFSLIS